MACSTRGLPLAFLTGLVSMGSQGGPQFDGRFQGLSVTNCLFPSLPSEGREQNSTRFGVYFLFAHQQLSISPSRLPRADCARDAGEELIAAGSRVPLLLPRILNGNFRLHCFLFEWLLHCPQRRTKTVQPKKLFLLLLEPVSKMVIFCQSLTKRSLPTSRTPGKSGLGSPHEACDFAGWVN